MSKIKVNDRVGYSKQFLQNIGCVSGDMPFARGVVKSLRNLGGLTLAEVVWDNVNDFPSNVNVASLWRVGSHES